MHPTHGILQRLINVAGYIAHVELGFILDPLLVVSAEFTFVPSHSHEDLRLDTKHYIISTVGVPPCMLLCGREIMALTHVVLCNNYAPASHIEFYLNRVYLGNININQEIDVGINMCYMLDGFWA